MANKKQKSMSKDYKVDAAYPVLCDECKSFLKMGKSHICWNPEGLPNAKPTDSCSRGERDQDGK